MEFKRQLARAVSGNILLSVPGIRSRVRPRRRTGTHPSSAITFPKPRWCSRAFALWHFKQVEPGLTTHALRFSY